MPRDTPTDRLKVTSPADFGSVTDQGSPTCTGLHLITDYRDATSGQRPDVRGACWVPLAGSVLERFDAHEMEFEPLGVTLPWLVPDGELVTVLLYFTTSAGNPIKRTEFMGKPFGWKRVRDTLTFLPGQDTGMHALRHLFASKLLDAGESIKTLAAFLGHRDPAFTLNTYTHLMPAISGRSRSAIDGMWASTGLRPHTTVSHRLRRLAPVCGLNPAYRLTHPRTTPGRTLRRVHSGWHLTN